MSGIHHMSFNGNYCHAVQKKEKITIELSLVSDPLLLIMEYVSGGNLLEHLRNRRPENIDSRVYENELTAKDLLSFALQAARGMAHLAHNNVSSSSCYLVR